MINKDILYTIWCPKYYKYTFYSNRIIIQRLNKLIYICDDLTFNSLKQYSFFKCLKNCLTMEKDPYYPKQYNIYFHENYIQSIIRQKTINTLLNV